MGTRAMLVVASLLVVSGVRDAGFNSKLGVSDHHAGRHPGGKPSRKPSGKVPQPGVPQPGVPQPEQEIWEPTSKQLRHCSACTWFWPYLSKGVALHEPEKKAFFEKAIITLLHSCPGFVDESDCSDFLKSLQQEPPLELCRNKTDSAEFCGCIVARSLDYEEPPRCAASLQMG
eukprot:CAMPEP_0171094550 /NCGR_PEP_ID=MMETSP0766_2-20121228/41551_1 /TAXON_ID=439317 /ORGANISM="Gambierdiscus australes, Strain CAWD 149" /LENGTH=172 /DNA_ID=CAMNT_0011553217 /DNA_START=56 /DNA_END=574 /DNA_ORIENTATION=-